MAQMSGMAAPMPPMGGAPAPGENDMIAQLLQATMQKWSGGEMQIAGEKQALIQTLMELVGIQVPQAAEAPMEDGMPAEGLEQEPTAGMY